MSSDNEDNNKSCDITDEEFNDTFKTSTINKTDDETSCITKEKEDIEEFELGNGNLHFLPAKFNFTRKASVDVYFDSNIEKEIEKERINCKIIYI